MECQNCWCRNLRNATIIGGIGRLNIPLQRKCRTPPHFVLRLREQQHKHMYMSDIAGRIIGKSATIGVSQGKGTKGRGSGDVKTWLCFPSNILFRQRDKGRERDGMKMWKEVLDCISQISASLTHWQRPSFPFPPIISTSSYVVLGKGGGAFLSTLSDDVIHSSAANKKPPPPRAPTPIPLFKTPSSCIPEVRHVFWFFWQRKLKSRASTAYAQLRVILLNCSLNKQQLHHWFSNPGLFSLKPQLFIFRSRRTSILYIRFTPSVVSTSPCSASVKFCCVLYLHIANCQSDYIKTDCFQMLCELFTYCPTALPDLFRLCRNFGVKDLELMPLVK